jgi:glucose/arabinose dehydrogenase
MRYLLQAVSSAVLLASLGPACGGGQSTPSSQTPSGAITGRERLWWDQQAPDAEELARYSYVLYVDGLPVVLPGATCGALAAEGPTASCSSTLPALQPGQRTLELAARVTLNGAVLESARSAPLVVTVTGSASLGSTLPRVQPGEMRGPGGARYVIEQVAAGLDRPSALARTPDGLLLIAGRLGDIRIAEGGRLAEVPAVELSDADTSDACSPTLVVAADFVSTRQVFVGYVVRDSRGLRAGRVVRFREVGGVLGEPAVIVDGLPAEVSAPRIRIGPDGALYVGTVAHDPRDAGDLGSYAGKILRFTTTGGTPPDNPYRSSPVFSSGHLGRVDFDWEPATRDLWHAEPGPAGVSLGQPGSDRRIRRQAFLEGVQAAGMAFHAGSTPAAWRNDLFIASVEQECLYRVSGLSMPRAEPSVERLLAGDFGRIVAVLSASDGLYFATGNGGTDEGGRPADAVYRIRDADVQAGLGDRRRR